MGIVNNYSPLWMEVLWLIAWLIGTMKSGRDWWWEMCAF